MKVKHKIRQNIFRQKLTVNITAFILACMIVIYSIIAIVVSYMAGDAFARMKAKNFQSVANDTVSQIKGYLDKFETASGIMAQNPVLVNAVSKATKEQPVSQNEDFQDLIQIFKKFTEDNDEVLNIGFGVVQEDNLYTQEGKNLGSEYSLRESEIYEAIEKNQVIVTEPYQDTITGELCVSIVEPIRSGNTPVGLLFIDLNLEYFSELVSTLSIGETGRAALYYVDGTIIASADRSILGQKASEELGFTGKDYYAELANPTGRVIDFSYHGMSQKATIIEVPGCGWRFISGMSKAEYLREVSFIIIFLVVSILFATILISILATRHIKKKLSPIQKINSYILRLADGYIDFDVVQRKCAKTMHRKHLNIHKRN